MVKVVSKLAVIPPEKEILLNDFALRSFRDDADGDYIAARMAYRSKLVPQFLWLSQQAIEKYLKCILVLNRIPAKKLQHDLGRALSRVEEGCWFELRLHSESRRFIEYLNGFRVRYAELSYYVHDYEIVKLDRTVWELRRYCQVIQRHLVNAHGEQCELARIKASEDRPHEFRFFRGFLEKVLTERKHPARAALIWQNFFFGSRRRRKIRLARIAYANNAPLWLHPEILDEVLKYVDISKRVQDAYREWAAQQDKDEKSADSEDSAEC